MTRLFQVQAEVSKVETRQNGWVRIVYDTQENLTQEQIGRIASWHNGKPGWLCFLQEEPVKPEDAIELPPLTKKEGEKSPAQRLRAAVYILSQQKGVADPEAYYRDFMENVINQVKERLV